MRFQKAIITLAIVSVMSMFQACGTSGGGIGQTPAVENLAASRLNVNVESYPSLSKAVESAHGKTVFISDKQILTENLIIPQDVYLTILNGGSIERAVNSSLTINGQFSAGINQVFYGFNRGGITFGAGAVKEVYPQWWGARADGNMAFDDAPGINAAVNSVTSGSVAISGDVFNINSQITVKPGITLSGNGKTVIRAGTPLQKMIVLNGNAVVDGLVVDGNNTFKDGRIQQDGGEFGILALNSSYNTIRNCTVSRFRTAGIAIMAWAAEKGDEAHYNTIDHCTVTNFDFADAGAGVGGLNIIIRSMYAGDDAENLGDITHYNYAYNDRVSHNTVTGSTTLNGLHGVIVHNSRDNTITGNSMQGHSGSAIELDPKAINTMVNGNLINDSGGASINVAYGSKDTTITDNRIYGTHGSYNYAIGVFYGVENTVISNNTLDSKFDTYSGPENRAPGAGVLIAQYAKNITVANNSIKGYRYGIWARTMMYPDVVGAKNTEYYLTGFSDLLIKDNVIKGAYTQAGNTLHRLALPQNTLYGIWLNKNSAHDDIDHGSMINRGIILEGNLVDGVEYPYVISEAVATSLNPSRIEDVVFRDNKAINCTSAAGIPNYPQYVNMQLSKYLGINNSWNFIAKESGAPPATALFGFGEKVVVTNRDSNVGAIAEYVFTTAGKFEPITNH